MHAFGALQCLFLVDVAFQIVQQCQQVSSQRAIPAHHQHVADAVDFTCSVFSCRVMSIACQLHSVIRYSDMGMVWCDSLAVQQCCVNMGKAQGIAKESRA
jgi:hypothetical protein